MGKLIVNNFMTIDGFYDSEDGSLDEVFSHRWSGYTSIDEFDGYNLSLLERCGTLVLGRRTYIGNQSHWSAIDETSQETRVRKDLAKRFKEIQKVVVGSSAEGLDLKGWGAARFVDRLSYVEYLRQEKQESASDILVMMSRLMWNEMLERQLVDEIHLTVFPMALGKGRPIFAKSPRCAFRLLDSHVYPDAGNVLLRYGIVYE